MTRNIIATIFAILVIIGLVYIVNEKKTAIAEIDSYDECAEAGYPIMESFPPRCATPDGRSFTASSSEVLTSPATTTGTTTESITKSCKPTGCSGQICSDEDVASTCEYREVYACYKQARCERQATGECGWTETTAFKSCVQAVGL
jgi:eight-cysteine-cluster-containing protein